MITQFTRSCIWEEIMKLLLIIQNQVRSILIKMMIHILIEVVDIFQIYIGLFKNKIQSSDELFICY